MVETIPLMVIFMVLIGFCYGFFGIIHTSTLHSIAARTYSFETFRQRANLNYFREDGSGLTKPRNFSKKGWRFHAVQHENDPRDRFVATERPISFGRSVASEGGAEDQHNTRIFSIKNRNEEVSVNPVWIMVGYGICLNAGCGDK